MRRVGRGFDHRTLEAIRLMAVERVRGMESAHDRSLPRNIEGQLAAIKRMPQLVRYLPSSYYRLYYRLVK